jgi:rhodanese-related sulfurtransferase
MLKSGRPVVFTLGSMLFVAVLSGASLAPAPPARAAGVQRITVLELDRLMAAGRALAVDVRSTEAFADGHLPGALHVPLADAARLARSVATSAAGRAVVTYCSCPAEHSSAEAAAILIANGVADARALVGGYPEWVRAGGKVER